MADSSTPLLTKRYAVVTGANKGIGFKMCRQLAGKGVIVLLTARDEERGRKAIELLKQDGISDNVLFHQLDVADPTSVASLAEFVRTHFGKLDILVNNAAVNGVIYHGEAVGDWPSDGQADWNEIASQNDELADWNEIASQTYELAEECLQINYYGAKRMVEALSPLLQLSESARIVNVASPLEILSISNEWAKGVLNDEENLTEERVDEVINVFLRDFKQGCLKENGWPLHYTAYKLSQFCLNAYTKIGATKYQNSRVSEIDFSRAETITPDQVADTYGRIGLASVRPAEFVILIRDENRHNTKSGIQKGLK